MLKQYVTFFKDVLKELPKLKLPKRKETITYLIIVVIIALFSSLMFFGIDFLSFKIIKKIIHLFY